MSDYYKVICTYKNIDTLVYGKTYYASVHPNGVQLFIYTKIPERHDVFEPRGCYDISCFISLAEFRENRIDSIFFD